MERETIAWRVKAKAVAILDDGVVIETSAGREVLNAETVILATGYRPVNALANEIKDLCGKVTIVGNALKAANALAASREGFWAGYSI
jgi:flavin-dependent dehydrogenase